MKLTKTQLKQIIKEELNEIGKKQGAHEERLAQQMAQKSEKEQEAEELRQILGARWQVNVRMLKGEDRYQLTVHKVHPDLAFGDEEGLHPNILAAYKQAGGVTGTGLSAREWWWEITPEERDAVETP